MKIFQQGSGIMFLSTQDVRRYGYRIELIGRVSDAIETHDTDAMLILLPLCEDESMHMPRAAKRLREALEV